MAGSWEENQKWRAGRTQAASQRRSGKVRIYTTSSCFWCRKAKEWMKDNNISFEEINVEQNPEKQEELVSRSGQFGVPVIDVDGRMMLGWDAARFREMMEE